MEKHRLSRAISFSFLRKGEPYKCVLYQFAQLLLTQLILNRKPIAPLGIFYRRMLMPVRLIRGCKFATSDDRPEMPAGINESIGWPII